MSWNWLLFSTRIFRSSSRSLFPCSFGAAWMLPFPGVWTSWWFSDAAGRLPTLVKVLVLGWGQLLGEDLLAPYFDFSLKAVAVFFSRCPVCWEESSRLPCECASLQRCRVCRLSALSGTSEPGEGQNSALGIFHLLFCSQLFLGC